MGEPVQTERAPLAQRRSPCDWWIALAIITLAYAVMPDGPWYRETGAALLVLFANEIRTGRYRTAHGS